MHLLTGQKQFAINMNFSKRKWSISGKHLFTVNTPNGPWTGWKEGLPSPPVRLLMRLATRYCRHPAHHQWGQNKGSHSHTLHPRSMQNVKKICSRYGIQTHFKVNSTIKNLLVSQKRPGPQSKQKWGHLLVPMWGCGIHRRDL